MAKGDFSSGSSESVIPEAVLESVNSTLRSLEQLKPQFMQLVGLTKDLDVLSQLQPLQRAQAYFLIAKAASTLFAVRLRCEGVDLDKHPINSELDRLSLYETKLEKLQDLGKAPLRPSTALNQRAAARFIEHSLPDLTAAQRQSLREISKGERPRVNYTERVSQKRRKFQSSGSSSIQAAAQDFLEKAAKELMGENKSGFKGPLFYVSDDDEGGQHGEDGEEEVIKGLVEISSDDD
ncbi:hypothetical protein MLD38_028211 [Melastoma candidum]|uniref:Uncharacterized protein n=1 Tax=Melastoma candidum TaxID=119954 RepID=A0ACB9N1Y0_9MYRT|nr:hypothetical protein MLD38_028211 [Melastoma candidum]